MIDIATAMEEWTMVEAIMERPTLDNVVSRYDPKVVGRYDSTFVAAEVKGVCKAGGVSDVVGDLTAEYLRRQMRPCAITYMNKKVKEGLEEKGFKVEGTITATVNVATGYKVIGSRATTVTTNLDGAAKVFNVQCVQLPSGLDTYIISDKEFCTETSPHYGAGVDVGKKYVAFTKAASELIASNKGVFTHEASTIHLHDHQAALTAMFLKDDQRWNDAGGAIVYTIHNLGYGRGDAFMSVYDASILKFAGINYYEWVDKEGKKQLGTGRVGRDGFDALEFHGKANFLKAALNYADMVNCVSRHYATEVVSAPFGGGVEELVKALRAEGRFRGITNRIDVTYNYFLPNGGDLVVPYRITDEAGRMCYADIARGKVANREAFNELRRLNGRAEIDVNKPTVCAVARLGDQKFRHMLADDGAYLRQLLASGVNVVIRADNQDSLAKKIADDDKLYPTLLKLYNEIELKAQKEGRKTNFVWENNDNNLKDKAGKVVKDDRDSHLLYAMSDYLLNPALYEPCGLTQLIAQLMGTIPIVTRTGGLKDTVIDYTPLDGKGTGFIINTNTPNTPHEMVQTMERALRVAPPGSKGWKQILKNCSKLDLAWGDNEIRAYKALYGDGHRHAQDARAAKQAAARAAAAQAAPLTQPVAVGP